MNTPSLDVAAEAWWARACRGLAALREPATQRQVAPLLGMSQGGFGLYETGQRTPRMAPAVAWANTVGGRLALHPRRRRNPMVTVSAWAPAAGGNLRALRDAAGLAQRQLAARAGLALATVQRVEAAGPVSVTSWAQYVLGVAWLPELLGPDGAPACHTPRMSTDNTDARGLGRRLYGDSTGRWLLVTGADGAGLPGELDGLAGLGAPAAVVKTIYERGKAMPGRPAVQAALATLLGVRQQNVSYALVKGVDPDLDAEAWATLVRLYHDRDLMESAIRDAERRANPPR